MGRVKRYKKVKAMDPFAKGGGGGLKKGHRSEDLSRNLPPDVKNHQAQRLNNLDGDGNTKKKKLKRRLPQWAHEELMETAKRVREKHADPEMKGRRQSDIQRPTIEGKREDESMRQFNKRVKEGTAQMLKDEFKEHSSTNKRRKKYLEDKKRKNKLKKQGKWEEVKRRERLDEEAIAAEEEQTRRAASHTRSKKSGAPSAVEGRSSGSNWGAPGRADDDEGTSFPDKEQIRFGEVAHAPPNLAKIPKPRGFKDQGQAKSWARGAHIWQAIVGGARNDDKAHDKLKVNSSREVGKRGLGGQGNADDNGERSRLEAEAKKAQKRQMEEMRQRVQEAYSGLKKKRRAGQTQFVGSDL